MLLIPGKRSSDINNINEFSEISRKIIIYVKNKNNLLDQTNSSISITNICVQNGNVGGLQSNNEKLYSINMYFGTINNPLYYDQNFKAQINRDADVRITDYAYSYKMINKFRDIVETRDYVNQIIEGEYIRYSDNQSQFDENEIVPCDPRYYNLDHQILVTDDDRGYYTEYNNELGFDRIAMNYGGIAYKLHQFLDSNTRLYVSSVFIDDPYKLMSIDKNINELIDSIVCEIENYALLLLLSSYRIILDYEYGYNAFDIHRSFKVMNKNDEIFEQANFFETVKRSYERIRELNSKIRMTIIYNNSQTYVKITPLDPKDFNITNSKTTLSDKNMYDFVLNHYN